MTDYDDLFAETAPDDSVFAEKRALGLNEVDIDNGEAADDA